MTAPASLLEALPGVVIAVREIRPYVTESGHAIVALAESGQGVVITLQSEAPRTASEVMEIIKKGQTE